MQAVVVYLNEPDPYAFIFSKDTSTECLNDHQLNRLFLEVQERWANHVLGSRGYIFLNEVLVSLGFERTKNGQLTGWWNGSSEGDGYISFDIEEDEDEFKLNFNVDGVIINKL